MKTLVNALYRRPVLFLGAVQAGLAVAIQQGVVGWPGLVAIAAIIFVQQNLVTPAGPAPEDLS